MSLPQYIYIALCIFNVGYSITMDGKPKTDKHSFAITFVGTGLGVWLMHAGGFF